jgi:hypothetical protein
MIKHSGILIGTAGVYYVASQLAMRDFHAAVTYGNAPSVDILVGKLDGSATLSLQVKTSKSALRTRGRGTNKKPYRYDWAVGTKLSMKKLQQADLFAFVDLKGMKNELPDVFILPSRIVSDWFKGVIEKRYNGQENKLKWWRYMPKLEGVIKEHKNNWNIIEEYLNEKSRSSGK